MKLPAFCLVVLLPAWLAAASVPAAAVDPNDIERLLDAIARIENGQCRSPLNLQIWGPPMRLYPFLFLTWGGIENILEKKYKKLA